MTELYGQAVIVGDVITKVGDQPIRTSDDLLRVAAAIDSDAPVQLTYVRGGASHTTTLDPTPLVIR
jgi:S1-C subfamily serine protease